jgi:photosystem II stability/assembly factor-like uncharacterized protein
MKAFGAREKLSHKYSSIKSLAPVASPLAHIFTAFPKYLCLSLVVLSVLSILSCSEKAVDPKTKSAAQTDWQKIEIGTNENLHDVWFVDGTNAFAVGDNGTILHYDGAAWNGMSSGTTNDLFAVWGCGMDNVYAAGDSGTILLYDGMSWSAMTSGVNEPITALWRSDGDLYCNPGWVAVYALAGSPPGTLLLYDYWSGPTPVWQTFPVGSTEELLNIAGSNVSGEYFEICAVGRNGAVHFFDGIDWHESDTGITDDLFAVAGDAPDHLFVVAENGNVYQNTKRWLEDSPSRSWRQVAGFAGGRLLDIAMRSYNDIYMVGENGRIVRAVQGQPDSAGLG